MKIPYHLIYLLLCLLTASTGVSGQDLTSAFDKVLQDAFPTDGPGATALVAKDGKIIYQKAIGKANLELDVDMQPEHIFRIGSITKQFTACAILKLMEEGKLSLDDEITKFIEDYPTHGKTITVEHLLTHTSGIKSYTGLDKWDDEARKKDFTPEEMIDYFKDEPMDFDPGERFLYNNSGYFLLGYIIEQVSGKTYEEYIDENFFKPLGMEHSYYGNTTRLIPKRVAGYTKADDQYRNAAFLSMTQPFAAGSLISNVADLNTWYQAVMAHKVVSKESLAKAHTPYKLNDGSSTNYGYGWGMGKVQGSPTIQHGGGINGFSTSSIYLPDEKVFVAVFSNCPCNSPGSPANKLAAIAIGKPMKELTPIEVPAKELEKYVGKYELNPNFVLNITLEGNQLSAHPTGQRPAEIYPYEKDKFFLKVVEAQLVFHIDADGKVDSLTLVQGGIEQKGKRID